MLCNFSSFSQEGQPSPCANPPLTQEEFLQLPYLGLSEAELNVYIIQMQEYTNDKARSSASCGTDDGFIALPIHIYDHTVPRLSQNAIDQLIKAVNEDFNNLGFKFKFFVSCTEAPIISPFNNLIPIVPFITPISTLCPNIPNAINVHIVNSIVNAAGYYNLGGNNIVIDNSLVPTVGIPGFTIDKHGLSHELGHFFGLLAHTHEFVNSPFLCQHEPVSRTKTFSILSTVCTGSAIQGIIGRKMCEYTGDGFCDTPADPDLSGKVNGACTFIGADTDLFGVAYLPDTRNLMSYTSASCLVLLWHSEKK